MAGQLKRKTPIVSQQALKKAAIEKAAAEGGSSLVPFGFVRPDVSPPPRQEERNVVPFSGRGEGVGDGSGVTLPALTYFPAAMKPPIQQAPRITFAVKPAAAVAAVVAAGEPA